MPARHKLTDKQHKQIIRRYAECNNLSTVAREFGVSINTVKRHVKADAKTAEIVRRKKEENTLDMLQYMEGQKGKIQTLLTNILEAMNDPDKLAKTNPRDLATAYGIIWDKVMSGAPKANDEYLQKAREILGGVNGVIK